MDDEAKGILREILELTQDNNDMLRAMRGAQWWARAMKALYWVVILGLSLSLYYYIQPLLDSVLRSYQSMLQNVEKVGGLTGSMGNVDTKAIQSAIEGMLNKTQ